MTIFDPYAGLNLPPLSTPHCEEKFSFQWFPESGVLAPVGMNGELLGKEEARQVYAQLLNGIENYLILTSQDEIDAFNGHQVRSRIEREPRATVDRPCVYIIRATGTNRYKIGKANKAGHRIRELKKQSPYPLELVHTIPTDTPFETERNLHQLLRPFRVHGEWFEMSEMRVRLMKAALTPLSGIGDMLSVDELETY
jgi:hypothetical protein